MVRCANTFNFSRRSTLFTRVGKLALYLLIHRVVVGTFGNGTFAAVNVMSHMSTTSSVNANKKTRKIMDNTENPGNADDPICAQKRSRNYENNCNQ